MGKVADHIDLLSQYYARMQIHRNSHYAVRNINGTSKNKCACLSWIGHYRTATNSRRTLCSVLGCGEFAKVGAHIMIVDGRFSQQWWIVPFCHLCNHTANDYLEHGMVMYLKRDVQLISANQSLSCKRADWLEDL